MRVQFTPLARRDIAIITRFIAGDNPHRAVSFAQELIDACESLSDQPERYALLARHRRRGLRRRPFGHYAIIYRVQNDGVEVIRILSSWLDLDEALGEV